MHTLGVLLEPVLLPDQVIAVAKSAFYQLRLVHHLRPFLENYHLTSITHVLATSRVSYCNELYIGLATLGIDTETAASSEHGFAYAAGASRLRYNALI